MPHTLLLAEPRGFCAGVVRAIDVLDEVLDREEPPIYAFHEIVHNRDVVDGVRARGAVFVDTIDPGERDARNRQTLTGVSPFAILEAQRTFEQHLKQDRNRSLSHSAIGVLEYHSGRTSAAREAFERAIRGDSGNVVALLYDAHLALERGEASRAQKALDRVLRSEKTSLIGNLIAARASLERRDILGAQEHLDIALRTSRGFAPAVVEQAYLDHARDDKEGALKRLQPVFRVNPYSLRLRRLMRTLGV